MRSTIRWNFVPHQSANLSLQTGQPYNDVMPVHSAFLKYFHEVCKTGSIRKAARHLYVASSAINRQILKVESELGVKLFERSHAGATLTPAGELLAKHVEFALTDFERTLQSISTMDRESPKRITIAGQESVIPRFLPPALMAVHARFPDVATSFKAASGLQLNDMLQSGLADIALTFDPQEASGIIRFAERQLPVGAVLAPGHPLGRRERVSLADCAEFPLLLPDRSWPLRQLLDQEIRKANLRPQVKTSSNSVEFLRSMLDLEVGIGFQTAVGIETEIEQQLLLHLPLYNPDLITQTLAVCTRADHEDWEPLQHVLRLLAAKLEEY